MSLALGFALFQSSMVTVSFFVFEWILKLIFNDHIYYVQKFLCMVSAVSIRLSSFDFDLALLWKYFRFLVFYFFLTGLNFDVDIKFNLRDWLLLVYIHFSQMCQGCSFESHIDLSFLFFRLGVWFSHPVLYKFQFFIQYIPQDFVPLNLLSI